MTKVDMSFFKKSQVYDIGYTAFPSKQKYTLSNLKTLISHHTRSHEVSPGFFRTKFLGAEFSLKKLYILMVNANLKSLSVDELKDATEIFFKDHKKLKLRGKSYPICFQNAAGRETPNYCTPTYISYDAQFEIERLFLYKDKSSLSAIQLELRELNSLRMATKIFEDNTFMREDLGGWKGNFFNSMRGLYTDSKYVLDSWGEDGGSMAHIMTKKEWSTTQLFKTYLDIVPGTLDYRP